MSGDDNNRSIRVPNKGDIVWARRHFPRRWFPAVVLSVSDLGVFVSFFNHDDVVSPPSYFLESDVVPFEDAFPSLVPRHYQCDASLHSALRLFGQRIISSLRCNCLTDRVGDEPGKFYPNSVLDFVLDAAVSPWVEVPRFVEAVRAVAQVHAFRDYASVQQKILYSETQNTGVNLKLHRCSSLSLKMNSVTQECVPLAPEGQYQITSKKGGESIAITATSRLKSTVSVPEENSAHSLRNEILIIPETPTDNGNAKLLMHSSALDPLSVVGKSIKSERQNLLILKNISNSHMVDICFGNFLTKISVHPNFLTKFSNYINIRNCRLADIETTVYVNRKRRRLDKHALSHVFPDIGGVQEREANSYITRPRITEIKMLEPEENIKEDNQARCLSGTGMNFTDEVQKVDLNIQNLTLSNFLGSHCDISESNSSVYQKRLQISCSGDTTPLKSKGSTRKKLSSGYCLVESKDSQQPVASCSTFNLKVGKQLKPHVPFSPTSLFMLFPRNFNLPSKAQLIKKFRVFGSVDYLKTRVSCCSSSAQVAFYQESDAVTAYLFAKKKSLFGSANVRFWLDPFEHKRGRFDRYSLTSPSAIKPLGPPPKSCLKNSDSLTQENKKKHYRVRFTVDPFEHERGGSNGFSLTSPSASKPLGPLLKSCLKNSNSLLY